MCPGLLLTGEGVRSHLNDLTVMCVPQHIFASFPLSLSLQCVVIHDAMETANGTESGSKMFAINAKEHLSSASLEIRTWSGVE